MPTRSDPALLPVRTGGAGGDLPVRRAVRRLRWFKRAFHDQVQAIGAASGVRYAVDDARLGQVFVAWLRDFEAQKPSGADARRAYVNFASGLMLRHLIGANPLSARGIPVGSDASNPAFYWPEGYVYVAFCLNVRAAVLEQDFDETLALAPDLADIRAWWSFRENVEADPTLAIAFLDLFSGAEPNWGAPGLFYAEAPRLGPAGD
jgi:hypothetical protein